MKLIKDNNKAFILFLISNMIVGITHADLIKDSETSINFRNIWVDRDFDGGFKSPNEANWSQGIIGKFNSGYTDSVIKVGLDLSGQYALRLSNHHDDTPNGIFIYDNSRKKLKRDFNKSGATFKIKYGESELKLGEIWPTNPILYFDNSRQLFSSYKGINFESEDIDNLKISMGKITHGNARNNDKFTKMSLNGNNDPNNNSDGLNYAGIDYQNNKRIKTAIWFGQLEDIYQQYYAQLNYKHQFNEIGLDFDSNYYKFKDDGQALFGSINSDIYAVKMNLKKGPSAFSLGIQKVDGDTVPMLNNNASPLNLHTFSILSFHQENELTWHVNYIHDFSHMGLDGLKIGARYLKGENISRKNFDDNSEREFSSFIDYKIPDGKLKGLGFTWQYFNVDRKYNTGYTDGVNFQENRLITSYTHKF